jgi:hypothetical protein
MPPGLWLGQTVSRHILIPPTETGSDADRDRFAFVTVALRPSVPSGWLEVTKAHERGPPFTALLMKYIKTRDASVVQMTM